MLVNNLHLLRHALVMSLLFEGYWALKFWNAPSPFKFQDIYNIPGMEDKLKNIVKKLLGRKG